MLQVEINDTPGHIVSLRKSAYLIGRSNVCNLRISDETLQLVHARLKVAGEGATLSPQSDAIIKLNDVTIAGEAQLHSGDRITLGKTELVVRDDRDSDATHSDPEGDERQKSLQDDGLRHRAVHVAAAGANKREQGRSAEPAANQSPVGSERGEQTEAEMPQAEFYEGRDEEPREKPQEWLLFGLSGTSRSKSYTVSSPAVLGRGRACDLQLAEAHLSRQHARLTPAPDGLIVEDLDSANGTYVNGRRIVKAVLKNGDELSLDTIKFRVAQPKQGSATDETVVQAGKVREAESSRASRKATGGDENQRAAGSEDAFGAGTSAESSGEHSRHETQDESESTRSHADKEAADRSAAYVDASSTDSAESEQRIRPPKGPSAIEIQRAALMRMKEEGEVPLSAQRRHSSNTHTTESGSRWPLMALILVFACAAWAATRFFGVPVV